MINADNYYSKANSLDFPSLPPALQKGYEFVDKVTMKGESWTAYHDSPTIQKVIDEYFKKLSEHLPEKSEKKNLQAEKTDEREKEVPFPRNEPKQEPKKSRPHKEHKSHSEKAEEEYVELMERIPDELRFMKRYIKLHNQKKTKEELLRFINSLQKVILERRIRKDSDWARQVNYMQEKLLEVYNGMKGNTIEIEIKPKVWAEFKREIESHKNYLSIQLIKRYVNALGLKVPIQTLSHILHNPFYCGLIAHNLLRGEIVQGNHPALITEDVFMKVHKLQKTDGFHQKKDNEDLPLKPLLHCAVCGSTYTGYLVKKKKLYYYKCNKRRCNCNKSAKSLHEKFTTLLERYRIDSVIKRSLFNFNCRLIC